MAFSIGGFFAKIGTALHNFFTKDGGAIQTGIAEAISAANVAASVAAIADPAGSAPVVAEIGKVTSGLALVQTAVKAEATVGVAAGLRDVVMLALGTGVGGGLWLDGRVYRGANGGAAGPTH